MKSHSSHIKLHNSHKNHNKRVAEFHKNHAIQVASGHNGSGLLAKSERFFYNKVIVKSLAFFQSRK